MFWLSTAPMIASLTLVSVMVSTHPRKHTHTHTQPPTVACNDGSSVGIRTRCAHLLFARSGAGLHTQSVLVDKISASEPSREVCQECVAGRAHKGLKMRMGVSVYVAWYSGLPFTVSPLDARALPGVLPWSQGRSYKRESTVVVAPPTPPYTHSAGKCEPAASGSQT